MYAGKQLEQILPHKYPMVLIDRIVEYDCEKGYLKAAVLINDNSLFFEPKLNGVPMWVGIEYMAQAIAALAGIHQKESGNKKTEPKIGFIIGSRNYQCKLPVFELGNTLEIRIKELFVDLELAAFECIIERNNNELATAQINVFQPASVSEFLKTNSGK